MCDVLVAITSADYETAKITPGSIESRGASYASSSELLAKAREAGGNRNDIHFGEIICGCKVVNDPSFRDALVSRYPKAIGGEMEGIGVAAACHRKNKPWLLAKGICDWGEIKTDDHQLAAARQSITFCLDILNLLVPGKTVLIF
jgi:nucleoside phosphorylase